MHTGFLTLIQLRFFTEQDTTSWKSSFPGDEHPFLAMRETPGKFPALTSNYELARQRSHTL